MKITGLTSIYNGLEGNYPFLECILCLLPFVDEYLINDVGSTDGTSEVLQKLADANKKVRVIRTPAYVSEHWECINNGISETLQYATGDWIIHSQADEFFHPQDMPSILREIRVNHSQGYNGIERKRYDICEWSRTGAHVYYTTRVFRNMDDLVFEDAGDRVYSPLMATCPNCDGRTHGFVRPLGFSEVPFYHLPMAFPKSWLKHKNHALFLATKQQDRLEVYNTYEKMHPDRPWRVHEIHEKLPEIFHGLIDLPEYQVREELFDIASKM